jgi:hypothetical protein
MSITKIVEEIERSAQTHEIGRLQEIRKEIKNRHRLAGHTIFHEESIKDTYAFHYGGRKELQFNVGTEPGDRIRHGVAFSFEPSQSLPDPDMLVPSAKRFNDFMRLHQDHYPDMRMWFWDENGKRSADYRPVPIEPDLIRRGMFIFLGKMQLSNNINFDLIVGDFDRLLTLYRFVEGHVAVPVVPQQSKKGFQFKPGCTTKSSKTKASYAERELDITLRHNDLQTALHEHLCSQYGEDNVGTENSNANGRVDLVVHQKGRYRFYEIKTSLTARGCISESLAQLLEYSYWPGAQVAERLIIVGESALDRESAQYLLTLREKFSLPIEYQQFSFEESKLVATQETDHGALR